MPVEAEQYYPLVLSIWSEVLELEPSRIRPDEHVLLQGGDSLHIARMLARLKQQLGVELNPARISDFATPLKMAACCKAACLPPVSAPVSELAEPAVLLPEYPATGMQQGLWFAEQLSENSGLYASAVCLHLQGKLDREMLRRALEYLLEAAPVFGSAFKLSLESKGLVVRAAAPCAGILMESCSTADALPGLLQQLLLQTNAMESRLYRFELVTLAVDRFCLVLCCHHVICDGWSGALMLRGLCSAYSHLLTGSGLPEPKPDTAFQAYALREARLLKDSALTSGHLQWWEQQLAGAACAHEWLWQQAPAPIWPHQLAHAQCRLDTELIKACQIYAARHELGIFTQMLTAWLLVLREFSGVSDQVLGIPVADRQVQEEASIGCFTRLMLLRSRGQQHGDLLSQAKAVDADFRQAQQHWLPLNALVTALKPRLLPDGNPWFSQLFAFQNFPSDACHLPGLEVRLAALPQSLGQYALKLEVLPGPANWLVQLEYASALFRSDQIHALLKAFHSSLRQLVLH